MGTRTLVIVLTAMFSLPGQALESEFEDAARYVGVPPQILFAMGQVESGLYKDKRILPWPWTLNIAGSAKRYETRDAMFQGLIEALRQGEQSIDIGPMQVNWYWHFDKLQSLWLITDPVVNIKIGASILKTHYEQHQDWWEAVGRYHRPADGAKHQAVAEQYRQRVRKFYDQQVKSEVGGAS